MTQMGENIIRAADGRPSGEQERARFVGAEAESDPPQRP
jgi:hypothetical protein